MCSQTYDHTSLIRFLERRFGVVEPQITAWRRQTCGDLWECFDFADPDYSFPKLPATTAAAAAADAACASHLPAPAPVFNEPLPRQEAGSKRRRPCATVGAPILIHLPHGAGRKLLSGRLSVTGRRPRKLSTRELRRGSVILSGLPAGTTPQVRVTLRVRVRGRTRTVVVDRTVAIHCP